MKEEIRRYKKVREDFIELIQTFPIQRRQEILFGTWSLKDVLSHLNGWTQHQLDVMQDLHNNVQPPTVPKTFEYNAASVAKRKSWSWEAVYREFFDLGDQLIESYEALPQELWDKKIWETKRFTPKIYFGFEIEHYTTEHMPEIQKVLKDL